VQCVSGAYRAKKSAEEIAEAVKHLPSEVKPTSNSATTHAHGPPPSVPDIIRTAAAEAEPSEAKYGGAYTAKDPATVDMKAVIDGMCHKNCHAAWEQYEKCEARIEKSGEGNCAGWYMDYFHCIDTCSTKQLFKTLA